MAAFDHFNASIVASTKLISMYRDLRALRGLGERGRLDAKNLDLLWLPRSAVVASMSALDAYVHAVIYEQIPLAFLKAPVPDALCDAAAGVIPVKNAATFKEALPILTAPDSIAQLSRKLGDSLSFLSYQAPDKIMGGYKLIGYDTIFEDVSDLWPGPRTTANDIKRTLSKYYKRRNNIAHEGDRDANGADRAMQPQYAKDCQDFVENLVARLNRVVYGV